MPQRVLGLDISQSTIKAVVLSPGGLTGGRILAAKTLDIHACGGIEPALQKLAGDKIFRDADCRISLPPGDFIFRQVTLPFRDESRIKKTLAFELEPLVPLPIEDVVTDYLLIPHNGLLVTALPKKSVRDWIEKVESALGQVSVIDISATALTAQILADRKPGVCGFVLDIGSDSTGAVFYENGAIVQVRSFAFGGDRITAGIADDLSVEKNSAEKLKINGNYLAGSRHVGEACRNFCSEIKNTIEYMKLNGVLQNDPVQMTLTGGGSLFAGLRKELENYFSIPVEVLDLIKTAKLEVEETARLSCVPPMMNTALAAALRTFKGRKSFNFRQGEFASRHVQLNVRENFKWAAILAGIILSLAIVNQLLDYGLKTRRLNNIKNQISLTFKKNFPGPGVMVDPVQQLRTKLDENRNTFGLDGGSSKLSVLDILKEISSLVPPSLNIVISNLSYEDKTVAIRGEAKRMDDITALKYELLKSGYFKDVKMGSTSLVKDGGKVDFDFRIELK